VEEECAKNVMQYIILRISLQKKEGICDKYGGKLIQREDDKPQIIRKRIKVYKKQTAHVINHYKKRKILVEVNTEKPIPDIFEDTVRAIES